MVVVAENKPNHDYTSSGLVICVLCIIVGVLGVETSGSDEKTSPNTIIRRVGSLYASFAPS